MKKLSLILMVFVLVLVGCDTSKPKESKKTNVCDLDTEECKKAEMTTYKGLEDDHVFLLINFKDIEKKLADEKFSGIVYFGYTNCPWCQEAVPIMNDVAKEKKSNIYYVDKKAKDNQANPEWEKVVTKRLDEAYGLEVDEETNEPRLYVPEVIVVKDGKIVGHHMGTLDEHDAREREMTKEEQGKLKDIYKSMFSKLK